MFVEGEKRNRTAEAIIASNTVSDRRVPKVKEYKYRYKYKYKYKYRRVPKVLII